MSKIESLLKNYYKWTTKTYSYQNRMITIWCNNQFTLDYLNLYLTVHFEKKRTEDINEWEIRVIVDDKLHDSMKKNVVNENNDYKGYRVYYEATGCITIESKSLKKRWHIARKEQNNLGFVQDIYCWIRRTLIQQICAKENMVLFHGACVSIDGQACLVLGEKGMGKSYVANHLMYQKHWSYVSADQTIVIGKEDGTIYVRGNITSYRLEEKDFDLYAKEASKKLLLFRKEDRYVHKNGKINLPPAFLEIYFHILSKQNVQLKNVIILSEEKYDLESMEEEERIALITKYALHDSRENSTCNTELQNYVLQHLARIILRKCNVFSFSTRYPFELLYECLMSQNK